MDTPRTSIVTLASRTFSNRLWSSIKMPFIFVIILTTVMYVSSNSIISVLIGLPIFAFYWSENKKWCRFYITSIHINSSGQLNILFLDKNESKELKTDIKALVIDKKFVWYKVRGRVPYLYIEAATGRLHIKQYEIGDWDEKIIDKVHNDLLQAFLLHTTVDL